MARNKYDVDEVVEQKFDINAFCACAYAFLIGTWNVSSEVFAD